MSFEGHSLTSAEISHLAEIHGVCWPRLALSLLGGIYRSWFCSNPENRAGAAAVALAQGWKFVPEVLLPCLGVLPGSRDEDGLAALPGAWPV